MAIPVPTEYAPFEIDQNGEHGEVFTRPWVVELVLDSVGFTTDRALHRLTLVEPSCGSGAFLGIIASRISASCRFYGADLASARDAVRAYDLLPRNVDEARSRARAVLIADGWDAAVVDEVVMAWVLRQDFLLSDYRDESVDFVVGNPPYIRLEDIPTDRSNAYRRAWPTMAGRADIYVGFIEKGLTLLAKGGRLGFICADRWMRNQYGKALREMVSQSHAVRLVISMHDVDAFETSVSAYPAITVLANEQQGSAVVVETNARFDAESAEALRDFVDKTHESRLRTEAFSAARLPHWFSGRESWPQGSPERLAMLEYLSDNFPPLEDDATGTRVGIGVASGADGVYVVPQAVDVEPDRLLPLSMVRDIATGTFAWSGHYLVNPWGETGLVKLSDYPKLADYYETNGLVLRGRHIAKSRPDTWYRTIDRVHPQLTARPKLLLQDMRLTIHPVLDEGQAYPHHNLYFVVSGRWDLRVLGAILMSRVANAFIEAYAVKMRGGTLRFQAQYLRRIRVPRLSDVSEADRAALAEAFDRRDIEHATDIALRLYGLEEVPA